MSSVPNSSITVIDLLRHGELEGDEDVFRGSTDDSLSDYGWQQMVNAIENKDGWDIIVTSPLQSCCEFADLIAQEDSIDLEINKNLEEIDFGLWEGLSPKEIIKEDTELLNQWWQSPTRITPPDGEDYHVFRARVLIAFKKIIDENKGHRVLIVTHSGVIRTILTHILGMLDENIFHLNVNYASFSRIHIHHDMSGDWGSLIQHN